MRNESFPPGHAESGKRSEAENLQANVSVRSLPTNIGNSEQRSNNLVEEKIDRRAICSRDDCRAKIVES